MTTSRFTGRIANTMILLAPVSLLITTGSDGNPNDWIHLAFALTAAGVTLSYTAAAVKKREDSVEQKNRDLERAARISHEQARNRRDQHARLTEVMSDSNRRAWEAIGRLPGHLEAAGEFLKQAEADWGQRVSSPFWTSLERSKLKLKDFRDEVVTIEALAKLYTDTAAGYDRAPPPFAVPEVSISVLELYRTIHDNISGSIRLAMTDIEFVKEATRRLQNFDDDGPHG
ncbi:hypothetical protein [Millisia brevis]|uniref:hypothetical protein n=1 Tax=Millisia brevis TaxID=264148 RepID=UPI0012EE8D6D|nr:hypothetical protein [Millisia brevis]